jgi:hypothetical protein
MLFFIYARFFLDELDPSLSVCIAFGLEMEVP